jgi:DNA-binding NarL/FixJ family response regulator
MATKVLFLSAHTLLRQGLSCLFQQEDDLELVAEGASGKAAMEKILELSPEVVLIALPDGNTPEVSNWIRETYPQIKVVVLFFQDDPDYIFTMLRSGISGCLVKDFSYEEVVKAIRQVVSNQAYLNPVATKIFMEKLQELPEGITQSHPKLTPREREILNLLVRGNKNAQIAEQLNLSPKTVEAHRSNLMKKLGLKGIAELTRYALQTGLISGV